ncbi:MAG TPA: adenylyl-sulfate kinase [Mycobacteriales bacterium]|nr:adenylyl-sulfate kinase [Mycobacteriales bacterium]
MPEDTATLDLAGLALLDQVLLGLAGDARLPSADVYLDEEGTPVASRNDGRLVGLREPRWERPEDVRAEGPVVLATGGSLPVAELPGGATVLLPMGAVRPDDARVPAWAAAWTRAAATAGGRVIAVPVSPYDVASRADALAAAYSSGPLVDVAIAPQPTGDGRTLFFTGLSGSGKSTVARAVVERLAGTRSITLLDGDVVRTHLSKGLGFSKEDRDVNIRRIGWVAAEVTKHGGLAVCAPIAPYDATRQWVRTTVESAGGPGSFLLVWVSTPIEECEKRDVKGLYAKARRGEITGFTGIDDPYEAPTDAALELDTSKVSLDDAVAKVLDLLS